MRVIVGFGLIGVLGACSGDGPSDGTPTEATCDALRTDPLGTVPVEEWPDGIRTVKDEVEALEGSYEAVDDCTGNKVTVILTSVAQQDIGLVATPYPADSPCGCTQDPEFAPDANLEMTSQIGSFSVRVDKFDDPFVVNNIFEFDGATYAPSEPLVFRACTSENIDPESGSLYRDVDIIFRVPESRLFELVFVLDPLDGSDDVVCTLTDFTRL